jgi:hypothetical protein
MAGDIDFMRADRGPPLTPWRKMWLDYLRGVKPFDLSTTRGRICLAALHILQADDRAKGIKPHASRADHTSADAQRPAKEADDRVRAAIQEMASELKAAGWVK